MTTDLQPLPRANGTSVAHRQLTAEQVELIKRQICKPKHREATDDELALFIGQCERTGLDPFSHQIYAVYRHDNSIGDEKLVIQTGIDGFRLVAERTGKYIGQDGPWWCGADGKWRDTWFADEPPKAARVVVKKLIGGVAAETPAVAHFSEYNAATKIWDTKPSLMIAKCAEALALRKAFPQELSGLYTTDELPAADAEVVAPGRPPVRPPIEVVDRDTFTDDPPPSEPAAADVVETIDPKTANDLFDEFRARGCTLAMFRQFVEGTGMTSLPDDLTAPETRLNVLAGLSMSQADDLMRALDLIPKVAP